MALSHTKLSYIGHSAAPKNWVRSVNSLVFFSAPPGPLYLLNNRVHHSRQSRAADESQTVGITAMAENPQLEQPLSSDPLDPEDYEHLLEDYSHFVPPSERLN